MNPPSVPLSGFKYLQQVAPLLAKLRDNGTSRDCAGNRDLRYDRYAALLLLYFFSPTLTSLRSIQLATELGKVQRVTGGGRVSLGSLSEAQHVFDPALLRNVLGELAAQVPKREPHPDHAALRDLVAVDGSLLKALPRMAWALWQDNQHRAAKVHVAFEVFGAGPIDATVTAGNTSEREQLRAELITPGKVYVFDRGYESYELLAQIRAAGSSFVARLQQDAAFEVKTERLVTAAAKEAGVERDVELKRLGTSHHKDHNKGTPLRLVIVANSDARPGEDRKLVLVTDRLDWDAELVALAYKYRWLVELFFRWLKRILGCRHLLAQSAEGVAMQVYCALIASILMTLWTGERPDKRAYEMFCHLFSGWATEEEVEAFLKKRQQAKAGKAKKAKSSA